MDLIYTHRYDNKSFNTQLKYSLRSVEKYMKGIDRVIVVGFDPMLSGVEHIEFEDLKSPARNIYNKLMYVARRSDISEDFIYMADDHFLCAPVNADHYPYYSNGTLEGLYRTQNNGYRIIIKNTLDILRSAGKDTRNFNIHCPIRYNRTLLRDVDEYYRDRIDSPLWVLLKSVYCNHLMLYEQNELKDCKIRSNLSDGEIERRIYGRDCFSTGREWINPNIIKYLRNKYPEKSKYE